MPVPWYEQPAITEKLFIFGRAIQGIDPYDIVLEPDIGKYYGGYCSFAERKISVNPTLFAVSDHEQYVYTKALLVHEAGHRRYTTPTAIPANARVVANLLEDERIERRMCQEFIGACWLLHQLAVKLYEEADPIDETTDSPREVLAYLLQKRWTLRTGHPIKGNLSPKNQECWAQITPLVEQAWHTEYSVIVDHFAYQIAEILGLNHQVTPRQNPPHDTRRLI